MSWKINREKCIRCGGCVGTCPVVAIELKESGIVNDTKKCTLCGICENACPVRAIKVDKK